MSLHQTNALIDHLDKNLTVTPGEAPSEASAEIQRLIAEDEDVAKEWNYLNLAVDAVRQKGLYEQVGMVRSQWEAQAANQEGYTEGASTTSEAQTEEKPASGVVRNLYRNMMRVAACALLIAGGATIFKYVRLSSSSLYSAYYSSYDLNTSRGSSTTDPIEQAYAEKNWPEVLARFSAAKERNNKIDFLAGMADLELKKVDDAIAHFEQVMATNSTTHTDYFEDEAEYYLAISWLAKNKVNEAMPILEKIKANKDHLYHQKVSKMSFTDLRLVQYKENK
jgi:tetratricopeptide (TPR) repeat protein